MNEKENLDNSRKSRLKWAYCPICGTKIPQVENIQYCIKCGVDLQYINTHMRMPSPKNTISLVAPTASSHQPYSYRVQKPLREKITEEDLLNLDDKKLWSSLTSLGMTAAAFIAMNLVAFAAVFILMLFSLSSEEMYNIIANPYFIIFSSFLELILFIVPFLFVGRYLQKPNLNNRLIILGVTTKGFNKIQLFKEILIGLIFAVIGVLLVMFVSFVIELLLTVIFGNEIVSGIIGAPGELDVIITSSDLLSIILLVIIMIVIIGTSEEVLFRGFLQKSLVRNLGKSWGLLVTALIFSSIHLIGIFFSPESLTTLVISLLLNFFPFFAISILLGLIYYWRKENLIAVMITHGVYNAITIIIAFLVFSIF